MSDEKYFGKYRGTVTNNADPQNQGRIRVTVPGLTNFTETWAMPCVPVAAAQMGMYSIPPSASSVWVEFEEGNLEYPIWSGCFWGASEKPPADISSLVLLTKGGNGIIISDTPGTPGGIVIKSPQGSSITINDTGIYITNGKGAMITMVGPVVSANNGALTVL